MRGFSIGALLAMLAAGDGVPGLQARRAPPSLARAREDRNRPRASVPGGVRRALFRAQMDAWAGAERNLRNAGIAV